MRKMIVSAIATRTRRTAPGQAKRRLITGLRFSLTAALLIYLPTTVVWGADNTITGTVAGDHLTSGNYNAFYGGWTGTWTTTASYSVYVGSAAGWANNGSYNTAVGSGAMEFDNSDTPATGDYNTAIGASSGYSNSSGAYNVFLGYKSGMKNRDGSNNTFVGAGAGEYNVSGGPNTFLGYVAGYLNVDGARNTFLGNYAGHDNVSGHHNIYIGDHAGENELGSYKLYIAPSNTSTPLIYGEFDNKILKINGSLQVTGNITSASTATGDTFLGGLAGSSNTSGQLNTFIGTYAGANNTTGNSNTYIGQAAGYLSMGSGNVFIGNGAGYNEAGSNLLYIANGVGSPLIWGDFDDKLVKINGNLIMASDERLKKNITPLHASLEKVTRLRGVSYEWKDTAQKKKGFGGAKDIGLIAQEVEQVLPELVHTDAKGYKAVAYDKLAPVLIEALKEQEVNFTAELRQKDARIEKLEKTLETMTRRMDTLENSMRGK